MSLSEVIMHALGEDLGAQGVRTHEQFVDWVRREGQEGIARQIGAFFHSERFSSALQGCDFQTCMFMDCAKAGNEAGVRAALEVGLSPDTADERYGRTVLMRCARSGSTAAARCVRALLDAGADVGQRAHDGTTAVHVACEEAREAEVLELLEGQGTWVLVARDRQGRTPLDLLREPRPQEEAGSCSRPRQHAVSGDPEKGLAQTEARLRRMQMILRVGRYAQGVLPGTSSDGLDLPACYRRAWTPGSHRFFPPAFRRTAKLLLLHRGRPPCAAGDGSSSGLLPAPVWERVFGFLGRGCVAERPSSSGGRCPNCDQQADCSEPFCRQCGHAAPPSDARSVDEEPDDVLSDESSF